MTSMVKFTHEIAQDVHDGLMSRDAALEQYGKLISADDLDDALSMIGAVEYGTDVDGEDIIILHIHLGMG